MTMVCVGDPLAHESGDERTSRTRSTERVATVLVPASTSNIGSGFDCVGMAVDRHLTVTARVSAAGRGHVAIHRQGTVRQVTATAETDLITVGFLRACHVAQRSLDEDVLFDADSDIAVGRGLGSSAAALVAGALLANELLVLRLTPPQIVELCTAVEGHPDNVAAAVYGGAVLSIVRPGGLVHTVPLSVHEPLAVVLAVPDFITETKIARGVLPPVLPHARAVLAAGRAAALVEGLRTGDVELLRLALDDLLHVPYRRALIRGYREVEDAALNAGAIGATLSGAGSSLLALTHRSHAKTVRAAMQTAWEELNVGVETFVCERPSAGARFVNTPVSHAVA